MRIRTIKPEFWTDSKMSKLSHFAKLFYIGTWNYSDDVGRFRADPKMIKGALFPLDDSVTIGMIEGALTELSVNGRVKLYEHDGDKYGMVIKFADNQVINRPSKFKHPAPPREIHGALTDISRTEVGSRKWEIGSSSVQEGFDLFWKAYPKKQAKQEALKAWEKISPDTHLIETILKSVEIQKQRKDWLKDDGQFIPLPTTWINQRRWEDESVASGHETPNIKSGKELRVEREKEIAAYVASTGCVVQNNVG